MPPWQSERQGRGYLQLLRLTSRRPSSVQLDRLLVRWRLIGRIQTTVCVINHIGRRVGRRVGRQLAGGFVGHRGGHRSGGSVPVRVLYERCKRWCAGLKLIDLVVGDRLAVQAAIEQRWVTGGILLLQTLMAFAGRLQVTRSIGLQTVASGLRVALIAAVDHDPERNGRHDKVVEALLLVVVAAATAEVLHRARIAVVRNLSRRHARIPSVGCCLRSGSKKRSDSFPFHTMQHWRCTGAARRLATRLATRLAVRRCLQTVVVVRCFRRPCTLNCVCVCIVRVIAVVGFGLWWSGMECGEIEGEKGRQLLVDCNVG